MLRNHQTTLLSMKLQITVKDICLAPRIIRFGVKLFQKDLIQNTTYYKIEEYLVEIENECTCYTMF